MPHTRREFLSTTAASIAALSVPSAFGAIMQNASKATIKVDTSKAEHRISRHIYGHFAEHLGRCIYGGIWVGPESKIPNINGYRKDVVEALKALKIPNLRWPGGCFADDYHWRDGIGPRADRPKTVNIHWGNYVEDNSFGTHEFMDLCELLECDAYVAFNVGSGSPAEMRAWLEYMTFDRDSSLVLERKRNGREKPWKLPFVGIGNENWGCGGDMTPEFYSNLFNQFRVFARDFGPNHPTRIACGPNVEDYNWAEVVLKNGRGVQGMSWHFYTHWPDWRQKGPALADDADSWQGMLSQALRLETILTKADAIFDKADPENRKGIYFDEWGTWHRTEQGDTALYQQNTIRDALVASVSFDIFHKHSRRVRMANIAQTVNVLQSMILTEVEGQNRMVLTPTYHAFEMYKPHMDAMNLPIDIKSSDYTMGERTIPQVSASASKNEDGSINVSLTNLHHEQSVEIEIDLAGASLAKVNGRILTAEKLDAHNSFDAPKAVVPSAFDGAKVSKGGLTVALPARSIVVLKVS
jgi:alpha-N-arabinofuranosidase